MKKKARQSLLSARYLVDAGEADPEELKRRNLKGDSGVFTKAKLIELKRRMDPELWAVLEKMDRITETYADTLYRPERELRMRAARREAERIMTTGAGQ